MAENTSDSKKVASNRDVNVIKSDATTDEKAATKSSVQADKDVNANKLDTNTVSVNKLQRSSNVAGLTESKAADENIEQKAEESPLGTRFMNHTNDFPGDATAIRTVTLNKPQSAGGSETITQTLGAFGFSEVINESNTSNTTKVKLDFPLTPTLNGKPVLSSTRHFSTNLVFSNNKWTFASAEDEENYNKFLAFQPSDYKATLPAIEDSQIAVAGYTWKVTSATPDGAGLGAETLSPYAGISQNIVIDYTKEEHTVTYKFEDPSGNQVGSSVPVTGAAGSNQPVSLTLPAGYQLASGSLPTSVTIPTSDQTISLPVKYQLTITLSGESRFNYADDNWKNLVETNELPASGYSVGFKDANARVQLSNGDVTYNENRNVGTYTVSLTEKGLNDIKDQLGDNFVYPDLKDVKSEAKFIINKGNKTISLMGGDTKVFDNTSTLPEQGTFYSGLGLADDDQGRISVYNSDGTLRTIQLTPADVEFWFNGHKIDKDQAKNVGTYNLRLTDDFINKVKAADGNNGNNYEWAYGTHTPTGSDTYTADYVIYQATGKANLSGNNSKLYDGNAVTTADVNKDGKITIDLTLPVYKKADAPGDEPQLLRTVPLGKYTLQDGDYTWANGIAPTKGGSYTINLNKDKILAHLQDRLVALAGMGTDPDDSTKSLSNVTISADDMDGQADFDINTTVTYQFVDDDNNKSAVGNPVVVTGLNGKSKDVSLNVPKGYELVGELPTKAAFGDTNKTININLVHKKDVATSQESVTRKITVNNPTTKQADSHDQTVTFTKEVTTDEVTGKSTTIYTPATKSIPEYTAPTFAGYVPNQTTIPATTVKPGDTPDAVIINYNPLVIKINLSGDNMTEFGDDLWQDFYTSDNLIVPGVQNYTLSLSSDQDADIADTHLDLMNGDLIFKEKPTNVGKYSVILSKQGLEGIKSQLKDVLGDLYADSEVQDSNITSDATFTIDKGHKEIDLNGYDSKTFDNTADIPSQDTFYTGLSLSQDSDQPGQISIYDSKDGKLHTITLEPEDVEFWLDGKKISKDQAKNVGSYSLRLTDSFIQKVKDQDGNHGNNYEWTYGTHTPSGDDTYTAEYDINPATGVATLAGSNSKVYDGKAVTTTEVNKDGKIIVDLTLPVYKQTDDEPQLLRTVDLGKYTLQDGDYTWASGAAPTKGGTYTINLNKDKILAHLQDQFNTLAGMGRDFDDPTKSLSNVTIATKDMKGTAKFDINTTVTYQFVDDDNNKSNVGDPEVVTGLNGNSQTVSLVVPDNYVLAAGQTLPTSAKFGDTNTTVDIHLKHDHITVTPDKPGTPGQPIDPSNPDGPKYPAGTDKDSLQSTVKRTINYIYQNGKQAESPVNDSLQFTDTKVIDKVTGEVISDEWSPAQNFNIITTPTIEGYTADQPSISNTNISHDHSAIVETVTYTPKDQTGKISYVDVNTGTEVGNTPLTGKTDEEVTINPSAPAGWKIVDGQNIPKTEKVTPTGIPTVYVKVEHKTTVVPPTDPKTPQDKLPDNPDKHYPDGVGKKDLNKTIVRQITVEKPDGTREHHDQSVKLTRSATVDEVTGEVTKYSDWTTGNFEEYDAPIVPGYTPSQAKVEGVRVTADSDFAPVEITYTPNDQNGKISYVDDKTNTEVGNTPLTGKTDEDVTITPVAPTGWKLVDGQNIPKTEKATPNGIDTVIVKVEHKTTTVPPTDPKTPEDKLPDNPDKHYPDGVSEKDLNKTIVRQITVVRPDGTRESHDQSVKLTRTATVDEVTGEVTKYSDWTTGNFDEYDAPVIAGYTPSQAKVDGVKVTADSNFDPVVITYVEDPIGQDITVKKGDTPSPEDGVKNHGDLDKVTDPKHPDAKTTYTWKKTPDTSVAGDVPATVIVHYPDGSNKPVDITVHVVDDTPVVPTKDPDPIGQDITVKKGDTPDPEDGVKNHGDLDKITDPKHPGTKTTYTWKKTPDTSVPGNVPATVIVHYPDGSNKPVDITVHVIDETPIPTKDPDPIGQDITVKKGDTPDPEDGVKNHGDLDKITDPKHPGTKTTYTWKKTPDTSVAGDVPATVIVHYPDGSNKPVDITVHVVDDTPVVPTKDPDPVGQDITVKKGDTPDPEDGVKNHGDLDKIIDPKHPGTKTTYTWKKTPDTSVAGDVPATVVVHYPDGSEKTVDITVHVVDDTPVVPTKNPEPTGQDIHTPQGKVPTPESAITNKDKMPDGTKYTWKEIPDVNTLGKHPSVVVVTYPDGTAVEVKVNVFVDGTPEAKKETKAPVVKKQVVEPTKVETRQKLVNNYVAPRAVEVQRAQAKGKRQLPQTGAKENIASEVLGMLSVGLGALTAGFASKRRKKNR
ncbi:Rib/alpha-like domain-containing protein [Lactobacillus paragasseri]|uniref:Rib/alpha-like domain-containing protein n=1 Tax=Lactobacillus paragasseri TaxID=2107999 RepID=UPI00254BC81A|nr:Rib/alpha-like domain-containing protein [Lactobacillus paragasseri]MDK7952779.1 Rib/alpha-like domain-containing protein [Lactobacillus paragasseri]